MEGEIVVSGYNFGVAVSEYVSIVTNALIAFATVGTFAVALGALSQWREQFRVSSRDQALLKLLEDIAEFHFNLATYSRFIKIGNRKLKRDYLTNKPIELEQQITEVSGYAQRIAKLELLIKTRFRPGELVNTERFLKEANAVTSNLVLDNKSFNLPNPSNELLQILEETLLEAGFTPSADFESLYKNAQKEIIDKSTKEVGL